MRALFFLIPMTTFCYASAQQVTDKEMKSHLKNVEKSKEKGTIIWDMDTVFIADAPYCIIVKKPNGALQGSNYSVMSLQGKELIYVKFGSYSAPNTVPGGNPYTPANANVCYYTFYFSDTRNMAQIGYGMKIYKTVAEENLIQGEQINSDAEARFIALNGMKFSQDAGNANMSAQPVNNNSSGNGNIVQRNRSAAISIINSQITQDNVVVGTVQMTQDAQNGIIIKTLSAFLPDGTKVAEATCNGLNAHNWNVITLKDNHSYWVNSSFNNDAINVVQYLVSSYYL